MRPFYLRKRARDLILEKQNNVWNSTNNYLNRIRKKKKKYYSAVHCITDNTK